MDLALHHIEWTGQLPSRSLSLDRVEDGNALGDRCAERLQELLALIFMDVHGWRSLWPYFLARFGAIFTHASQSVCTASTDFSNIFCSALLRSISMTRSMPPAPITVGTPT